MSPTVVLVHGMWESARSVAPLAWFLTRRGHRARPVDLAPSDGRVRIEILAEQLASYIERSIGRDQPIDVVGFSMGGIVSRHYVQRLGGAARVRRLVTVSAPHRGTIAAYLSQAPGIVQLRPGSAFLTSLNGHLEELDGVDFTSVWSPLDLTIFPADSSRLPIGNEVLIAAPLHALMLYDPRVLSAVAETLAR